MNSKFFSIGFVCTCKNQTLTDGEEAEPDVSIEEIAETTDIQSWLHATTENIVAVNEKVFAPEDFATANEHEKFVYGNDLVFVAIF